MIRVVKTVALIGAALAVTSLAVHALGDRRTLVPPPDVVAEEFVRQLVTGRSERALPLFSERVRPRMRAGDLEEFGRRLEAELGEVGNVSAEIESISGERAAASAQLDGARGTRTLRFELVREHGKWMIDGVADPATETVTPPAI